MRLWALAMAGALVAGCGGSGPSEEEGNAASGDVTVSLPPALPVAAATDPSAPTVEAPPEPEAPPPEETPAAAPKALPKAPPVAEPPPSEAPSEAPEPDADPAEPAEPAEPAAAPDPLPEASPPIAAEGLAGYIRGAGFQCDRVVATRRAAGGPYKFDCGTGGSYRGTMRRGRLYFRPWGDRR